MTNKSHARVKLEKTKDLILYLFDSRCIVCGKPSREVHEIIPISRGMTSLLIKNRVVICRVHHDWAHGVGTNVSIPVLQLKRQEFLIRKFLLDELQEKETIKKITT